MEERKFFSKEEKEEILKKTNGYCAHCGKKINLESMTVEHIYPISKGGTNELINLVALCKECNLSKSNFVYSYEWYYFLDDHYINEIAIYLRDKIYKENFPLGDVERPINIIFPEGEKIINKAKNKYIKLKTVKSIAIKYCLYPATTYDDEAVSSFLNKQFKTNFYNRYIVRNSLEKGNKIFLIRNNNFEIFGCYVFININNINFLIDSIKDELIEKLNCKFIYLVDIINKKNMELFIIHNKIVECIDDYCLINKTFVPKLYLKSPFNPLDDNESFIDIKDELFSSNSFGNQLPVISIEKIAYDIIKGKEKDDFSKPLIAEYFSQIASKMIIIKEKEKNLNI